MPRSAEPVVDVESERDDESDEDPMAWLGLTVKLGFARVASSDVSNPVYSADLSAAAAMLTEEQRVQLGFGADAEACTLIEERCAIDARSGFRVAVQLSLGGDGLGWDLEPYMSLSGAAQAFGAYTGPKLDFHLVDPLYLGLGVGFGFTWLKADGWDYGADIYGRIPARLTYYALPNLALVLEGAFGAGATGYAGKPQTVTDPRTGEAYTTSPSMTFGSGRMWDLSLGVRFP